LQKIALEAGAHMNLSKFHRDYLTLQGVMILPKRRENTGIVKTREKECVPVVPEYERGD
jgi:hypothetical protein